VYAFKAVEGTDELAFPKKVKPNPACDTRTEKIDSNEEALVGLSIHFVASYFMHTLNESFPKTVQLVLTPSYRHAQ